MLLNRPLCVCVCVCMDCPIGGHQEAESWWVVSTSVLIETSGKKKAIKSSYRGFAGSLVVKTSPSNIGVWVSSQVRELRCHMSLGHEIKTQNKGNILINSIKTLKMVQLKKKILLKVYL